MSMKKFMVFVMSVTLLMGGVMGCSSGTTNKEPSNTQTEAKVEDVKPEESKPQEEVKTESTSNTVTVYSPHPADAINIVVKAFEEATGLKVELVAAGTGELLKRVEAESNNPLGDVLWGGGAESLDAYSQYFEPFTPTEDDKIDPRYKDADGLWIGESPLPMVIMYNKDFVSEVDVPTGWGDLLDTKWKGKIAYADPAKSGSSFTILATMLTAFGKDTEDGWNFIREFVANLDGKLIGSSSGVYKGIADGEYSLGLTLEKEESKYVKAGAPVGIVYPKEGTSAVPDGVAIIKGCKNAENAKKFVDFVLSKECQTLMSSEQNRRTVRTDVGAPEGLIKMEEIKLVDYDFTWASEGKADILGQWKDIIIGK